MIVVHQNRSRFGLFFTAMTRRRVVYGVSEWDAAIAAVLAYVGGVQEMPRC